MDYRTDEKKMEKVDKIITRKVERKPQITNLDLTTYIRSQGLEISLEEVSHRRDKLEGIERVLIVEPKKPSLITYPLSLDRTEKLILHKLKRNHSISDLDLRTYLFSHEVSISLDDFVQKKNQLENKLIAYKMSGNPQISDLDLRAYLLTHGLEISLEDLTRRRTELEAKVKVQLTLFERPLEVRTMAKLSLVGGLFNSVLGGLLLYLLVLLGSGWIILESIGLILLLLGMLGAIFLVLGILGFGIAYDFWNGKEWAWNLGFIHAIACIIMGVLTLPIGSISIIIYAVILYYLAKPNVRSFKIQDFEVLT